uniref:zinc ABC transporter ATP-binding protein ZnuC n=1 Tax=Thaumasiovibrio occultus TaxID=1891184 RepID=UPI000B36376C|nr:zinc ABC transporter ATP-binding protein ZnuC [Thaumasiovibrio occultus]
MSYLIKLDTVTVSFNNRHVLDNVSLALNAGEITTLIGPNGAGKSTLVKVVTGLHTTFLGTVHRKPGLRIGYVPQKLALNSTLPLNVERFMRLAGKVTVDEINHALQQVKAEHLLHADMHKLSGGETQRVLLARALLRRPHLLVLDEPVQGVDVNGQLEMYALIGQLRETLSCAILMVSHDLHLVMAQTDHVICLHHHVCCHGSPEAISQHPEYVALFGRQSAEQLALYHHHHNHDHDLAGNAVGPCQHDHNDDHHSGKEHGHV